MIKAKFHSKNEANIGLVFINGGRFGGPEKRFVRISNWLISHSRFSVYIYISQRLIDWLSDKGLVFDKEINVTIYDQISSISKIHISQPKNIIKIKSKPYIPSKIKIIKNIFLQNYQLGKWVNKNKIKLLHGWHGAGEAMFLVKFFKNIKCIYSITSSYGTIGIPAKWFGNLSYKSIFFFMDGIEFLSQDIQKRYQKSGLTKPKEQTFVGDRSFIDFDKMYIAPKKIKIIAGAARLEPQKNIPLVVEAADILINKMKLNVYFDLLIPNDGAEAIKKKINSYKLEQYFTILFSNNPETNLSDSLIFLSLQDYNNYPSQLLLEAMACGCAIVATDVGETSKLVDKDVGFLTKKTSTDIAEKISYLIKDYDRTLKLGLNARNRIKRQYTIDNYGSYVKTIYDNILG